MTSRFHPGQQLASDPQFEHIKRTLLYAKFDSDEAEQYSFDPQHWDSETKPKERYRIATSSPQYARPFLFLHGSNGDVDVGLMQRLLERMDNAGAAGPVLEDLFCAHRVLGTGADRGVADIYEEISHIITDCPCPGQPNSDEWSFYDDPSHLPHLFWHSLGTARSTPWPTFGDQRIFMLQDGEAYVFGMADVLVDQPALVLHAKDSEAVPFAPADYRHLLDVGDALPIIQDGVCCHWLPPIARVPGPDGMSVMDRQNYVGKITRDCDGAARPVSPPPRLALDNVQDVLLLPPGYPAPRDSSFLRALLRNEVHIDNWPDHPDEDESWQAEDPHRDIDTSYLLLPRSWHDIARERLFVHSAAPIGKVDLDELHDVARKLGNDPTPVHVGQLCCHTFAAAVLLNSTKDEWKREHSRPVIEELRRIMDECKGVQA